MDEELIKDAVAILSKYHQARRGRIAMKIQQAKDDQTRLADVNDRDIWRQWYRLADRHQRERSSIQRIERQTGFRYALSLLSGQEAAHSAFNRYRARKMSRQHWEEHLALVELRRENEKSFWAWRHELRGHIRLSKRMREITEKREKAALQSEVIQQRFATAHPEYSLETNSAENSLSEETRLNCAIALVDFLTTAIVVVPVAPQMRDHFSQVGYRKEDSNECRVDCNPAINWMQSSRGR